MSSFTKPLWAASALCLLGSAAAADQVFADDLIVQGSACIGIDCSNGESFGFDTIRIKENNLRIKAQDTSTSASFPTVDWQLTFNESGNGGKNKFSIDDIDNNRTPFTIEAGSITDALYVSDAGDIGVGTDTPIVELHAVDGNTPTLRLEQDGSSGFGLQTWDLAGNETNFFIRDVTNGSRLPFRIQPNTPDQTMFLRTTSLTVNETGANFDTRIESDAITAAFFVDGATGDVGLGTDTPAEDLHIVSQPGVNRVAFEMDSAANDSDLRFVWNGTELKVSAQGQPTTALEMAPDGTTLFQGVVTADNFVVGGTTLNVPDYVFADDYDLLPLEEVEAFIVANSHLPKIPSAAEINNGTLDLTAMQLALLEKVEELTLYTLQQQKHIDALQQDINALTR